MIPDVDLGAVAAFCGAVVLVVVTLLVCAFLAFVLFHILKGFRAGGKKDG